MPRSNDMQRKNVTRACDLCKKRKVRCDGEHPCDRCKRSRRECEYRASYNRGHRSPSMRGYGQPSDRSSAWKHSDSTTQAPTDSAIGNEGEYGASLVLGSTNSDEATQVGNSSSSDEGFTGDASVDAFLRGVSLHLAQIGQGLPRNLFKRHEEDVGGSSRGVQTVILPEKTLAESCLEAYFHHGNATCRFLPHDWTYGILNKVYANDPKIVQDHTRMAIILLVIGTGCVWNASWRNEPMGPWKARALPFLHAAVERLRNVDRIYPPTIEILQAEVLKCQCELVLGHFNSAWMTLGWAIRLGQMIDIQREHMPTSADPLLAFYKRRVFWAMFMIDRYLAIILGRPMAIREGDIKVPLSPHVDKSLVPQIDARERKLLQGTVLHYELVKIIGKAAEQLYPVASTSQQYSLESREAADQIQKSMDVTVAGLEAELQAWLDTTPRFFHPNSQEPNDDDRFFDVPWILKRQQRTVQSAFFFANMLIYRNYLLHAFYCQSPSQPPSSPLPPRAKLCTDHALSMASLFSEFGVDEGKYNGTFWITSHFLFSAISILLVYLTLCQEPEQRALVEKAVEQAMESHGKLDNSVNITAQKLLEESRSRAKTVQSIKTPTSPVVAAASTGQSDPLEAPTEASDMNAGTPVPDPQDWRVPWDGQGDRANLMGPHVGFDSTNQVGLGPFGSSEGFDMIMDIGFDNLWYPLARETAP